MEELDLTEIFKVLWKRKIEIMVIILVFFVIGCIYTLKFVTPKYTSSITMILVSSDNDTDSTITTSDITLNSKLIETYRSLIKSKVILTQVIQNTGIDMDEEELKNSISVTNIDNTELIKITVENENNQVAAQLANELVNVFQEKVKEMYNINNIQVMGEASIEENPSNINHQKDIIIFVLAGGFVSFVYIFVINLIDTTIKNAETIENEFGLPVLASIPKLRRRRKNPRN